MRGLVLEGVGRVDYRTDLPEPAIIAPGDALVAVRRTGLCGSDLHPYEGREPVRFGVIPGHEAVGEVVAIGRAVRRFRHGDRVVVPFTTSCGDCPPCRRGLTSRCQLGELFGFGPADAPDVPALEGAQAEFVRVPLADATLVGVPDGIGDAEAVMLADNLPTGWYAAERADIPTAGTVAVVGLGSVGLCAVGAARALDAGEILAVDPVARRRELAARLGAVAAAPDDATDALTALDTEGAGAVIEAAGTPAAQALACQLVRPGGTLSVIAVHTAERFAFSPVDAYDANLTVRAGRAPVRAVLDRLLPQVLSGEVAVPAVLTHPAMPLHDGPQAYERFAARDPDVIKIAFAPG